MLRGHIWDSARFSASAQESILLAAEVPKRAIYAADIDTAVRSLRAGDRLVVAGFRGLGRDRETIQKNIERVHAKRCAVMDAMTGNLSTGKNCKALVDEAVTAMANERRGPRKRTKKDRRMPWDQVAKFYFDKTLRNWQVEKAVAKGFEPMSYATMRRHFGKRDAIVGRPSAQKI